MILLPRCFHNFDCYGHKQKRLDIPKINLNSIRQYTNFTYKPHIIKAIMFPLVQLISFLLIHVSKMYQFSHGSHHSLCELEKKKKKKHITMFPQVHPINYYLIGKTVGGVINLKCVIYSISILSNVLGTAILHTNTLHCCPFFSYI